MSRYVVYGAGAVGGSIGAALFEQGHEVTLIARGAHLDAINERGLTYVSPKGTVVLPIPAVGDASAAEIGPDDVVLMAVKGQDTEEVLQALARAATSETSVVCVQNGIGNEPRALRYFANVYGMLVRSPMAHLSPGEVGVYGNPVFGILDIGRFPHGVDAQAEAIASQLDATGFSSMAQEKIMAWKCVKLLNSIQNSREVVVGAREGDSELGKMIRAEGAAALSAAGMELISDEVMNERRKVFSNFNAGESPFGSSSLQSVMRDTGRIEADYFNGEIVLLGRLHGIPTPANALLQRLARDVAEHRLAQGSLTEAELLARLS